jgi:GNAT superfamily N-acetyltransferase
MYIIRNSHSGDTSYVISTWITSYQERTSTRELRPSELHARIEHLLSLADTSLLVLTDVETPDLILGWSCSSESALHYVYVRDGFRRQGIATRLVARTNDPIHLVATHTTKLARTIGEARDIKFRPQLLDRLLRSEPGI